MEEFNYEDIYNDIERLQTEYEDNNTNIKWFDEHSTWRSIWFADRINLEEYIR